MKKGTILFNVILIMSLLNILVMSVLLMNKNLINAKKLSLSRLGKNISSSSKRDIIDYKIQQSFKRSLTKIAQDINHLPEETVSTRLFTDFSSNISHYSTINQDALPFEFNISIDKVVDSASHDFILLDVHFEEDAQNKKAYVFYRLKPPTLTPKDIDFLKNNQIEDVYRQYKDTLIEKKLLL